MVIELGIEQVNVWLVKFQLVDFVFEMVGLVMVKDVLEVL